MNPRTEHPVGYAFVELSSASEAERAITELSGEKILGREVSVQLSRKPEAKPESAPSKHIKTASEESRENAAENRVLEAALQDAVRRDVGSSDDTTMEESYAPDPNQLASDSPPFSPAPPETMEGVVLENSAQVDPEKTAKVVPENAIENVSDNGFEVIAEGAGYFSRLVPEHGTEEPLPPSTGSVTLPVEVKASLLHLTVWLADVPAGNIPI
jgi:RNA recognition motif-containing protein